MTFRSSLRLAADAARTNFLPGLLLQCVLVVFLAAYVFHEGTRTVLEHIAHWKQESGFRFTFVVYALASAVLPEALKVGILQSGRVNHRNVYDLLTGIPLWGAWGIVIDLFYRLQIGWFGATATVWVVLAKMAVDQFLFSPFIGTPVLAAVFGWRDTRFSRAGFRAIFTKKFLLERVFPLQVAGWIVWVPAVSLVYFMSSALQIPVATLIQCFWVLLFTFINKPLPTIRNSA